MENESSKLDGLVFYTSSGNRVRLEALDKDELAFKAHWSRSSHSEEDARELTAFIEETLQARINLTAIDSRKENETAALERWRQRIRGTSAT